MHALEAICFMYILFKLFSAMIYDMIKICLAVTIKTSTINSKVRYLRYQGCKLKQNTKCLGISNVPAILLYGCRWIFFLWWYIGYHIVMWGFCLVPFGKRRDEKTFYLTAVSWCHLENELRSPPVCSPYRIQCCPSNMQRFLPKNSIP